MTVFLRDADFVLHLGDALDVLRELPAESVDCVITSPPYWGLRDYGTGSWEGGDSTCAHGAAPVSGRVSRRSSTLEGGQATTDAADLAVRARKKTCSACGATRVDDQLGLEATPDEYVASMVAVFAEVRRVLSSTGSLWLNLGDSYAGSGPSGASYQSATTKRRAAGGGADGKFRVSKTLASRGLSYAEKKPVAPPGLKPKDLVGIPWRVALALQADGWYLRSDVIWSKPNPMPESITDRPTRSHEYVFLLTKSPRYYFDQEAVREPFDLRGQHPQKRLTSTAAQPKGAGRSAAGVQNPQCQGGTDFPLAVPQVETLDGMMGEAPRGQDGRRKTTVLGMNGSAQHRDGERWPNGGRNVRSVWEIATQPYSEAHFATYPKELVRRCILAGCPTSVCRTCGKPRERIVEITATETKTRKPHPSSTVRHGAPLGFGGGVPKSVHETTGWSDCAHDDYRPGVVLDPFIGSGTTALVAREQGRHAIGVELSPEYAALCARRLQQLALSEEPVA